MTTYGDGGSRGFGSQRGTVKWFNPTKGYGFITLENGTDAFCHASALSELPSPDLPQGATVQCEVQPGQRGLQVVNVLSVDISTADPSPSRRPSSASRESGALGDGRVKFFNEQKGFGFVMPDDGGPDVYIHASALRRAGIQTLIPEQKVRFSTRQGMKGTEVDHIELG